MTASRSVRLLMTVRALRSWGQGVMVVDFSLYLRALHWTAPAIGGVLMAALLLGTAFTLALGPLSDRLGRKRFLLYYEVVQALAALVAVLASAPALLVPAALLGGFGRGGNGSAGPFAPVEQAWLAHLTTRTERGRVFSVNAAIGAAGMALGAFSAALPAALSSWLPGALAYRPMFGVILVASLASFLLLLRVPETGAGQPPAAEVRQAAQEQGQENRLLLQLMGVNALNGIGIGLVGPLIAYWFAVRFHVGVARIGPVMALGFLLTALSSLGAGWLTARQGIIRTVTGMRLAGLLMLLLLPFMPTFGLAAVLHVLRTALNQGTAGARQALGMNLVRPHRRGLAASLNNISMQVPRAVGPLLAGVFFHGGLLALPFLIAAVFQGGYLYFYQKLFRRHDPLQEARVPPA